MPTLKPTSLGDQISTKISAWVLILVVTVITAIFLVSFLLSRQMFNKQVTIWNAIAPQQALTNLIDSDYFTIQREVEFLRSTGLFSFFVITDNKKHIVSKFGNIKYVNSNLIPIVDDAKAVWGYYYFKADFYQFIFPFALAAGLFLILILMVYFVIRWRMRISLESEFSRFNDFLAEIERVTQQLHQVYVQDAVFEMDLKYTYNSEQVIINRAISRLLDEISKANKSLREAVSHAEQRRFQEELTRTALQVAHDIGSPLAVLEIMQLTAESLPEESRICIRDATRRIRDISNSLLSKAKQDFSTQRESHIVPQMLHSLIGRVVSEKRMQYGGRADIEFQGEINSYTFFSAVKPIELSRVLSNLINNAVEAIENNNCIVVSLTDFGQEVLIQIQDNGKGIPSDVINQLGALGASFGKTHGTGVGLNHAINTVKDWGGRFEMTSQEGKGTIVQIYLPKCSPPSWFLSEIKITDGQLVVVIDDDESIHAVWEKKFAAFKRDTNVSVQLLHFNSPAKVIEWKSTVSVDVDVFYLCDNEFIGADMNGLDLIEKLQINNSSILVTSNVSDEVVLRCESGEIKLLPKDMASVIPVVGLV